MSLFRMKRSDAPPDNQMGGEIVSRRFWGLGAC